MRAHHDLLFFALLSFWAGFCHKFDFDTPSFDLFLFVLLEYIIGRLSTASPYYYDNNARRSCPYISQGIHHRSGTQSRLGKDKTAGMHLHAPRT